MKLSKKQAIKFAIIEETLRGCEGDNISIKEYVILENLWQSWQRSPASMIATMLYDGIFPFQDHGSITDPKAITPFKRKFGARLWNAGVTAYLLGDHDT